MRFEYQVDPPRWLGRLVIGLIAVSYVFAWASDLLLSSFVDRHPLILIALGPSDRNLALVVNEIDTIWYYVVGIARHLSTDPLFYLIGYWYGDNAVAWVGRRSRSFAEQADHIIPEFRKWSWIAVFLFPFNMICLLAGASGLRFRTFALVNIAGTVARLVLISQFASYFEGQISGVSGFIADNRILVFGGSLLIVGYTLYREFGSSDSDLQGLKDMTESESSDQPAEDD